MTEAALQPPAVAYRRRPSRPALRRFLQHRLAVIGTTIILLMVLACAFGPMLLPFDGLAINVRNRFLPPFQTAHVLGTDPLGRDQLARLLNAGRISLAVGFSVMILSMSLGIAVGTIAGFYGGKLGALLMRFVDAMLCFPSIFLLLAISAFIDPSVLSVIILISLTSWMEIARIVEAQIKSLRERDYAVAGEAIGASDRQIIVKELLPNAVAPIVVAATLNVAHAILSESYISFLGFGIQPPTPSWGNMLQDAQGYLRDAPWLALVPGIAITLAVTSFNFIGDGLRDALDPRMDGR